MKIINGWHLPDFDTLLSKSANNSSYPEINYQQGILDQALSFVANFNQAIDIGANVGYHTVRFSKLFSSVKSFEPASLNFECLIENTKTLENVEKFQLGIGDLNEELFLELEIATGNCGAFSFKDFKHVTENKISEKVEIRRIDEFNFTPDFIKIDTQGFEENVLLGALKTIEKHKPVILAEVAKKKPRRKVLDILEPFGYEISAASNSDSVFSIKGQQ